MERQKEYELRKMISSAIKDDIENVFDELYERVKDDLSMEIINALTVLEKAYKKQSDNSIQMGMLENEMLILVNPLREAIYWYIKKIFEKNPKIKWNGISRALKTEEEQILFADYILALYDEHKRGIQIGSMRDCSSKVNLIEEDTNTYSFQFPFIDEKYNKELIYYYGLDDSLNSEKEREVFVECEQHLFQKFDIMKVLQNQSQVFINLNILNNMSSRIDLKYYQLCKQRIASDINKISSTTIQSEWFISKKKMIRSKEELISILALFYYLSRLCMQKYMFKSGTYQSDIEYYCNYKKSKLFALAQQVGISKEVMNDYIEYFSMNTEVQNGNFTEFPIICLKDTLLWVPSSFALNDFQFSIVNGHYYKNIRFIAKDSTVSQSIVDYIISQAGRYNNIITASNVLYDVPGEKFKGKDLKSDIDVAVFDRSTNTMLIVECKWKENVYLNKDDYPHIEDAFRKIYSGQLEKHEYYLNLSANNISKLFDDEIDFSMISDLDTMYLFVDKRIQFHNNEENRHAIPIFMLAYLFEKYSSSNKLSLKAVINEIKEMQSKVKYERIKLKQPVTLKDITVI